MKSLFPGMNPYFESPDLWPGFHQFLAVEIARALNRLLSPQYFADVEVHSVLEDVTISGQKSIYADVAVVADEPVSPVYSPVMTAISAAPIIRPAVMPREIKLRTVNVHRADNKEIVTAIEILSPSNKRGQGLGEYIRKRRQLLRSEVHLVEIDLLRGGQRPGWEVTEPKLDTEYILLVNRFADEDVRLSEIWTIDLNQALPALPIPLLPPDPDIPLEMLTLIQTIYADGVYERKINYSEPLPPPKLRPAMQAWLLEQPSAN